MNVCACVDVLFVVKGAIVSRNQNFQELTRALTSESLSKPEMLNSCTFLHLSVRCQLENSTLEVKRTIMSDYLICSPGG